MVQWLKNTTVPMRTQVQSLALLSGWRILCCHELWCSCRSGSDPMWLWCRLVATALIQPLTWKLVHAASAALKTNKTKQNPKKRNRHGVPVVAQWLTNLTGTTRLWVRSLALLSGWRILRCRELWCRSQTWLRSGVAVAVVQVRSNSSDSTPSLGTSMCHRCSP